MNARYTCACELRERELISFERFKLKIVRGQGEKNEKCVCKWSRNES